MLTSMERRLKIYPPIKLTPAQKREVAKRKSELIKDIEAGMRGPARRVPLKALLKETRRRFPELTK